MKMKKNNLTTIFVTLFFVLFMVNVNALALSPETEVLLKLLVKKGVISQDDAVSLKHEVESVAPKGMDKETIKAEIKQEITEELKAEGGVLSGLQDNITISGAVEVDYQYRDHRNRNDANSDSTSDLFASTVELGIEAKVNEFTTANILVTAEDIDKSGNAANNDDASDPDNPFIDEVFVTIYNPAKCPFYAVLGKRPQPFSQLFTHTISDPITKDAYEIATSGATFGYAPADFFGLDAALTFYKGEKVMDQVGAIGSGPGRSTGAGYAATDDVSSYIVSVSAQPMEALAVGMAFDSEPGDDSRNETLSAFTEFSIADFTIDAEYFTATKREKHFTDNIDYKENAWVVGLAYQIMDPLELALRYESFDNDRSTDSDGDFDYTIVLGANYDLFENVTLMGEYRNLKEKAAAGSTYEETVNEFNFRVAVGF
jgi:hypothetical protein